MFIEVSDATHVAEARRQVTGFAHQKGLPQARIDQLAIVVTELATNLLKHAGRGHLHAGTVNDAGGPGLELLALDQGRGMRDPAQCMQDGYSTAGSMGSGLGALARLADTIQIYTRPGQGCAILCRFAAPNPRGTRPNLGAVLAPYPGEQVCGDNWSWSDGERGRTVMLVDGSGHGIEAARAAEAAVRSFQRNAQAGCEDLIASIHRALTPTRGAAVAVARIDKAARSIVFAGLGNIAGVLVSAGRQRHMVSLNGIAGHVAPRIRAFTYEFTEDPLVIMHSDGLTSRWNLGDYPGLLAQHPSLIAGVLLRDHRRGRDDASVVVMRGAE
jgi:anti-sigma regulatory factor (Ser/Thr protein kinase)